MNLLMSLSFLLSKDELGFDLAWWALLRFGSLDELFRKILGKIHLAKFCEFVL
ncbi:hypothetical protein [Campylobacter troglodytis]|uniref:hypothetical protein n=1 Tax=Campylobacter troglodytis TaxID=654363 RepID=UPI00163D1268|nr:hypothetical protein [Campylobacter troglodytis]